jgi:hypothetical protein
MVMGSMTYFLNFLRSIGNLSMMVTVEDKESLDLPFIVVDYA